MYYLPSVDPVFLANDSFSHHDVQSNYSHNMQMFNLMYF